MAFCHSIAIIFILYNVYFNDVYLCKSNTSNNNVNVFKNKIILLILINYNNNDKKIPD